MGEPRQTDERLRRWLNSDQASRERMCLALLALESHYTAIEPRRPEGGPDGARDIQALCGGEIVWGAVGFQNNVSDSPQEKSQAKGKFRGDLDAALRENPALRRFVFFTNVDLAPAEVEDLKKYANKKGLKQVDIYWRERMRERLDSVEGLAIRFQYLRVPLSEAEQVSFFERYGKSLTELITSHHISLSTHLERLEFLHWAARPVRDLHFTLTLDRWYRPRELGHVRAVATLRLRHEAQPFLGIGGRDDYVERADTTMKPAWRFKIYFWNGSLRKPSVIPSNPVLHESPDVSFGVRLTPATDITMESLDKAMLKVYLNEGLHIRVRHFQLSVNGYALFEQPYQHVPFKKHRWAQEAPELQCEWGLSGEEAAIPWVSHEFMPWISLERTPRRASAALISARPDLKLTNSPEGNGLSDDGDCANMQDAT